MRGPLRQGPERGTESPLLTVIAALFLSIAAAPLAAAAAGPEPAAQSGGIAAPAQGRTAAPETVQQPPLYTQEILSALKDLAALLSHSARVDRKELDLTATEIVKLDARIKELLGPSLLREIEAQERDSQNKTRLARAEEDLAGMRSAIALYYSDLEGKYPASPAGLVPKYLPALPELELPAHTKTAAVELTAAAGPDIAKAVTDTGGWLYFANPVSQNFGMLILNCSHKNDKGTELYKY